jgi:trans-aconitate methyltransferase
MTDSPVSEAAFDARYRHCSDPWQFATSPYEAGRYAATLAALTRATYRRGFEPGCSIGVLTQLLATRCDHLIATDLSETAVRLARQRCAGLANVDIHHSHLAGELPPGTFDLVIFSEIGYYFSIETLRQVAGLLAERLEPGGEFVATHWLGESPDHPLHGDTVHAVLEECLPWDKTGAWRHVGFRIDRWRAR